MAKKFSMHLTDEAEKRIQRLQERTRSAGTADVVRLALIALDEQVDLLRAGGSMFAKPVNAKSLIPYNPLFDVLTTLPDQPGGHSDLPIGEIHSSGSKIHQYNPPDVGPELPGKKYAGGSQ